MKPLIKLEFDKFIYNEQISFKDEKFRFNFAYPILGFINTNMQEIFNTIDINNITQLDGLFAQDDMFIAKIFYADEMKRQIENPSLATAEKERRFKVILNEIEKKQILFETIIKFCFLLNADKDKYETQLDKLIFICNKLGYTIKQPQSSYSITQDNVPLSATLKLDYITETTLDKLETEYIRFKQSNSATVNHYENIVYTCESIDELFFIEILKIFERKYIISVCKNCGKYFVPCKKNDALYCDRISPQNDKLTCKKYIATQPQGVAQLYKKMYMKKFVRAKRHKDDFTITNEFEKWKSQVDKVRSDFNNGLITENEFERWLLDNDK